MKQKTENKYPSLDRRSTAAFIADVCHFISVGYLWFRLSALKIGSDLETQSVGLTKCYSHTFVSATSLHDSVTVSFCSVVLIHKFSVVLFPSSSGG